MLLKVLHSICQQIWKTQQWSQDWKRTGFIPIPKKANAKECSNYHTITLIAQASKLCSKSFKLVANSMWAENFQMYKMGLEKAEEPEIKLPTFTGSWKKQGNSRQNIYFWFIHYAKSFWLCGSQQTAENS